MLKNPQLLILDEATSNLDLGTETIVRNIVESADRDMSVLIITHRSIENYKIDNVYVFNDGRVIEQGSPKSLKKCRGIMLWLAAILQNH